MTDLFARLEALQGELPTTPHIYRPLTAPQYETLEGQIYRMGPQIDGTPAWSPEKMFEWLQQQPPHIRGVAITMMRRAYQLEQVGIPPLPQAIPGRQKAPKQKAKRPLSQPMLPALRRWPPSRQAPPCRWPGAGERRPERHHPLCHHWPHPLDSTG
ncbi:hypothetical protein D3C77_566160 [compost metagenome]